MTRSLFRLVPLVLLSLISRSVLSFSLFELSIIEPSFTVFRDLIRRP